MCTDAVFLRREIKPYSGFQLQEAEKLAVRGVSPSVMLRRVLSNYGTA